MLVFGLLVILRMGFTLVFLYPFWGQPLLSLVNTHLLPLAKKKQVLLDEDRNLKLQMHPVVFAIRAGFPLKRLTGN